MILETAIAKLREPEVILLLITEHSEVNMASVELKASSDEVKAKQKEDSAIASILPKSMTALNDRNYNCSIFGVNQMTREEAQKLGPEFLGSKNNWERFIMKDGILIQSTLAKTVIRTLSLYHKIQSATY